MVALVILGLQVHSFSFGGGTASEFASKLEAYFGKPTVVLSSIEAPVPKILVSNERYEDLFPRLLTIGKLTGSADQSIGVAPSAWPINMLARNFGRLGAGMPERVDWAVPTGTRDSKQLSLKTKGNEVASMNDVKIALEPLKTSYHWFFSVAELGIHVENCSRTDFAKAVATSIGAKLVKTEDGYHFDLDPGVFRARVTSAQSASGPLMQMVYPSVRAKMLSVVYEEMTDLQILQTWQSQDSSVRLPVEKEEIKKVIADYLRSFEGSNAPASLKALAQQSIGLPATIEVSPQGTKVAIRQPDGTLAVF